jgi:hypothetical protein
MRLTFLNWPQVDPPNRATSLVRTALHVPYTQRNMGGKGTLTGLDSAILGGVLGTPAAQAAMQVRAGRGGARRVE